MVLQHREVYDRLAKFGAQQARARFTWTGIAHQLMKLVEGETPAVPPPATQPPVDEFAEEYELVGAAK